MIRLAGSGPGALSVGLHRTLLLGAALGAASCVDSTAPESLQVYAASSLTEVFRAMESSFEAMHPEVDVVVTFAGSQSLRFQIEQGAPADVFASADPTHVARLVDEGLAEPGRVFARNSLVVIVPAGNPARVERFEDLTRAGRIVLGAPTVPVGRYAREAIRNAQRRVGGTFESDVLSRVVSEESNVRLARAKVELGEAEAAIVYRTDARGGDLSVIELVPEDDVTADYSISALTTSTASPWSERWIAHVLSDEGQRIIASLGFLPARP